MTRTSSLFFTLAFLVLVLVALSFFIRDTEPLVAGNTDTATTTYEGGYDYDTTKAWLCNGDGLQCPDGTVVGRSGPRCEFTKCPGVIPVSNAKVEDDNKGVLAGSVTLSPICPVETMPPTPGCEPKPYETIIHILKGGKEVTTRRTTAQGGFTLEIAPGTYTVRAESAAVYPRCNDMEVTVTKDERTTIVIDCDSGIR